MSRFRRSISFGLTAGLVVALGAINGGAALADTASDDSAMARADVLADRAATADARGYIIVGSDIAESVDGATFYPTGPISSDTLVVIADSDGSLPGGLTEKALQSLVAEQRAGNITTSTTEISSQAATDVAPMADQNTAWHATSSSWSQAFTGGSVIGWDSTATIAYTFNTESNTGAKASGNGKGYYVGYNGSEFGTWSKWYFVGITDSSGVTSGTIPWGNVVANKQFKAICTMTYSCAGKFT